MSFLHPEPLPTRDMRRLQEYRARFGRPEEKSKNAVACKHNTSQALSAILGEEIGMFEVRI